MNIVPLPCFAAPPEPPPPPVDGVSFDPDSDVLDPAGFPSPPGGGEGTTPVDVAVMVAVGVGLAGVGLPPPIGS